MLIETIKLFLTLPCFSITTIMSPKNSVGDRQIHVLKQASLNFYTKQTVNRFIQNQILFLNSFCFTLKTFQITAAPDQILEKSTFPRNTFHLYVQVQWIHNVGFAIKGFFIYKTLILDKQTLTGDQLAYISCLVMLS